MNLRQTIHNILSETKYDDKVYLDVHQYAYVEELFPGCCIDLKPIIMVDDDMDDDLKTHISRLEYEYIMVDTIGLTELSVPGLEFMGVGRVMTLEFEAFPSWSIPIGTRILVSSVNIKEFFEFEGKTFDTILDKQTDISGNY